MNSAVNGSLSLGVTRPNPDHHLWNNNGTWWCHFTVHLPDFTKRRVRHSLYTADIAIARFLRDSVLAEALKSKGGVA